MMIKKPDHHEKYKFYSEEDACVEICNSSEYSYEEAEKFVESLGLVVRSGGHISYDSMFNDWRGFVNIEIENANTP